MIDGRANNRLKEDQRKSEQRGAEKCDEGKTPVKKSAIKKVPIPGKRKSVLQRLRDKQAEVAARYEKKAPDQSKEDMERNRK